MASTFVCEETPRVLPCYICGEQFLAGPLRRGPTPKCATCTAALARAKRQIREGRQKARKPGVQIRSAACKQCGKPFDFLPTDRNRKFCSVDCSKAAGRQNCKRYRAEKRYAGRKWGKFKDPTYKPPPRYKDFICKRCGTSFRSSQSSAHYCSTTCMAFELSERNRIYPLSTCSTCGKSFKPSRPNRKQVAAGYIQKTCSYQCAGMSERPNKPTRRSQTERLKKSGYWHPVDPIKVFDRDGWKCHLCGIRTPKRLRGTTDDRAPECDHIVPLAAGGAHSYENSACSCRRCNREKGATPLGQLLLFG